MEFPENAVNLTDEELKQRIIYYIDIVDGDPQPNNPQYVMEGFSCPEAEINSPLTGKTGSYSSEKVPEWTKNYNGDMVCCIKVLRFQFKWWGLQKAVEELVTKTFYPKLFTESHRKLISTAKEWFPMTNEDILKIWDNTAQEQKDGEGFVTDE